MIETTLHRYEMRRRDGKPFSLEQHAGLMRLKPNHYPHFSLTIDNSEVCYFGSSQRMLAEHRARLERYGLDVKEL